MKVFIDISKLSPKSLKRGIGSYSTGLYKSLKKFDKENLYSLVKNKTNKNNPDLIHYPYFDLFFLNLSIVKQKPTIVTIHDLTPLKHPEHFPAGLRGGLKLVIQKLALKSVKAIITDSLNSKKDIQSLLGINKDKIFVVYLAADSIYKKIKIAESKQKEIKEKYGIKNNFLLYVGDINWNKNISGLVKAFYKLKSDCQLVLVGNVFNDLNLLEAKEIRNLIDKLKLKKDILLPGFIPKKDLVLLYNLASLYIQPSFYEGFGLPVLEAISCGCPVLCSNKASLPEVGGKAVEYFDPSNTGELEEKIKMLILDANKLTNMSKNGLKQAKKFSWKKTALETKKVYEKVY